MQSSIHSEHEFNTISGDPNEATRELESSEAESSRQSSRLENEPDSAKDRAFPKGLVQAIHRFVARRIANTSDAEDVAQQALLRAFANLPSFRGENFRGWIYTIARHLIIDHYRARDRVRFVEVSEAALGETEPSLRTRHDVVHSICDCRARLGHWLECLTRRLPLEQQVAVLLADVHGHSDKSSATLLGMTVPSYKLMLHGARCRLREVCGGSCVLLENSPHRDARAGERSGRNFQPSGESPTNGLDRKCPGQGAQHSCDGLGSKCFASVNCRLGIKCCRQVPKLTSIRWTLLQALQFS